MDDLVRGYEPLIKSLAPRFVGRNGAELGDLVQEGRINVWQTLERGITPAAEHIENRMKDWVKFLDHQTPADYGQMLPIDDFRGLSA